MRKQTQHLYLEASKKADIIQITVAFESQRSLAFMKCNAFRYKYSIFLARTNTTDHPYYRIYINKMHRHLRRHDPETRAQIAFRFESMYRNLGSDLLGCTKLLHVKLLDAGVQKACCVFLFTNPATP